MSDHHRIDAALSLLGDVAIELPSWAFGNSGTRFRVFAAAGTPRTVQEKIADAAQVNAVTGAAPTVALHIPWDKVDDYGKLAAHAADEGIALGTINSNTFQDDDYVLGSICAPDARVRRKAIDHLLECVDIMDQTGSRDLKLWFADGTNYPGQDDLRLRRRRLVDSLRAVAAGLPAGVGLLLEYKLFEPAFYSTDVADWGQALSVCRLVGEQAVVCVDTGHHAPGVNIEQIVAALLAEGRLGGFDLNDRKYGDDDLMVGSIDPYQLFRIVHELVNAMRDDGDPVAQATARRTVYMLDQCHNIEARVPAVIRSVMTLQETFARALCVDRPALLAAQEAGDVVEANRILADAFATDVRPALAMLRIARGFPGDPYAAYRGSGDDERRAAARVGGTAASW